MRPLTATPDDATISLPLLTNPIFKINIKIINYIFNLQILKGQKTQHLLVMIYHSLNFLLRT